MIRSGNPLLDLKIDEFKDEMIKSMIAHKHKHNMNNDLTAHSNTPIESIDLITLSDHLNSEIKELQSLFIDNDNINSKETKKELLDLSNMCFFIYWYLDQVENGEPINDD